MALVISLALSSAAMSQSRSTRESDAKPSPEAKLISTTIEGDRQVSRWLVAESADDGSKEFTVHYQMNLTQLVSSYGRNSSELSSLHALLDSVVGGERRQITQIDIVGYASPDGSLSGNKALANRRATDFRGYINKHYNLAKVSGTTRGVALPWSATKSSVESSSIPSRAEVLDLVSSKHSMADIELGLKRIPAAWDYMCDNILPPMRSVEMQIKYTSWVEVVVSTPIEQSGRSRGRSGGNVYFLVVEQMPSDIMVVDNPCCTPLDFPSAVKGSFKYKVNGEKYKERASRRSYRTKYRYR